MSQNLFYDLFIDLLKDTFDSELQIVENLPNVIKNATNKQLKEALSSHEQETKNHVHRLKKIFKMLNENPTGKSCLVTRALFTEGNDWINKENCCAIKDSAIIISCQKIEHYEIAAYGSLCSLASYLREGVKDDRIDFDDIIDLLQASLDEEKESDEKLTDIAEGGFFSSGVNEEARKESIGATTSKP